jgi:DNA recombination protein RmuC
MIYILTAGIIAIVILLLYLIITQSRQKRDDSLLLLQQQMEALRTQLGENMNASAQRIDRVITDITAQVNQQMANIAQQLQTTTGQIGDRLDSASKTIADVKKGLGEVSEASKRIFDVAKDITELQDLLKPSKLRGGVGEVLLENLLADILPGKFKRQYKFKDGTQVDFVIFLKDRLVPVDSKFPIEPFRRVLEAKSEDERIKQKKKFINVVKGLIDEIASRYIKPDENTVNFAMMYIPAENIYYETIIREDDKEEPLLKYSIEKNVIPVSPNTFLAYLMTIMLGFRGMEIERNAKFVLDAISKLQMEIEVFKKEFDVLGGHIRNAMNKYDESYSKFLKIGATVTGVTKIGALPSGEK